MEGRRGPMYWWCMGPQICQRGRDGAHCRLLPARSVAPWPLLLTVLLAVTVVLAGCGGGGSSTPDPKPNSQPGTGKAVVEVGPGVDVAAVSGAMNAKGDITLTDVNGQAFYWRLGQGAAPFNGTLGKLNNFGIAVASRAGERGTWNGGEFTKLPVPAETVLNDINDGGLIAAGDGIGRATLVQPGGSAVTPLTGLPEGGSKATAISNDGYALVSLYETGDIVEPTGYGIWYQGSFTRLPADFKPADLTNPGPNGPTRIVGAKLLPVGADLRPHAAFLPMGGEAVVVGGLDTQALAANNNGDVVGEGSNGAFVYVGGREVNLNSQVSGGWYFRRALGISERVGGNVYLLAFGSNTAGLTAYCRITLPVPATP